MRVTIVDEFNCYEPHNGSRWEHFLFRLGLKKTFSFPGHRTIYLCPVEFDVEHEEHEASEMGTRVIGPVHSDVAEQVLRGLVEGLREAGIEVEVEHVADD